MAMKIRCLLLALPAILGLAAPAHAAGSVRVQVSPNVLLADGVSTATVTAEVYSASGRPVRDGTEVRFYTTAGNITQVAFTSSGVARATLTSSNVAQAANISVSAGLDQAIVSIPMVSKLVETSVGGRVMRVSGKYVAYSEDKRFIQADDQVKVVFRGVTIEANSVQVDINQGTLKALGKISVSSDEKTLVGDKLWLDTKSFEAYIVAVGNRIWFSAYGLTELPEKPKNRNPDFELVDLTDSKLLWVGKQANYIVDDRVQVQGARAYVGGIKSLRMPYHESSLRAGFGETGQYVGIGSQGLTLDLPLYLRMTPGASTALHLGYGSRSGTVGYFTRNTGLSVDLVQKYGFAGASEGQAMLTNMASLDAWGFSWNHTQQINKSTRLVANVQFPEHRDLYGRVDLTTGVPFGTIHMGMSGSKFHQGELTKTISLGFESKPRPLLNDKLMASVEVRSFQRDQQQFRAMQGLKIPVASAQYNSAGIKLRPASLNLPGKFTLDTTATLRGVVGDTFTGFGPGLETSLRRPLPNNGFVSLGLNYNHLATIDDILPVSGKVNSTFYASYPVTSKLRISAMGNAALDAPSRSSLAQLSYTFLKGWRFDLMHTMFSFGDVGDFDYQFGITRAIGNRDLSLYWSRREHRWFMEFGAARF